MAIKRPIKSLGPGSLIFGETGSDLDISCQVTAAKVTFDSDKEDDLPTLCGDTIAGEKTYTSKLEFSAGQDTERDGLIDWTWRHAGKEVPVKFIPNEGETATVQGTVVIDPVEFGGDVRKRNISEAEFDFVGLPTFTPDNTDDSTEYPPAPPAAWAASTAYAVGNKVTLSGGQVLTATAAGTSGTTEPAAPAVGGTVTDGTVTWRRDS